MRTGDVWATRDDGAVLVYDADDEYGRALGHIRLDDKDYSQRPVIALLARGGWEIGNTPPITAAGDSWRWQLRDAKGQWVEMGSEVKWLARGRWKFGTVIGSPSPGVATVEETLTALRHDLPSARLEVVREAVDVDVVHGVEVARDEKGRVDWKSLDLASRTPLPDAVTARGGRHQDFEKDVIEPVRVKLDALKKKYPDGLAAAIDAALSPPSAGPKPAMSAELMTLRRDPEIVKWVDDLRASQVRLRDLEDQNLRGTGSRKDLLAAEDETRSLLPHRMGGKYLAYDNAVIAYRQSTADWQRSNNEALQVIRPHSDQAKEILADVREVGQMVRVGIAVDLAQQSAPSPERARLQRELSRLRVEKNDLVKRRMSMKAGDAGLEDVLARLKEVMPEVTALQTQIDNIWDPSVDPEYEFQGLSLLDQRQNTEWKRRRTLARRVVAELVGNATETKQTWVSKEPESKYTSGETHRALTKEEQDAMTAGLLAYPASWVERFDQNTYTTSMAQRGWHSEKGHHITLSMQDGKTPSEDSGASVWGTIVHEEGHGMERVVPGLSGLEAMFWHDRMGENSKKLLHLEDGARFPDDNDPEKHIENIAKPTPLRYTLKVYGNVYRKDNKAWEVFTTGVEEVLGTGRDQYTQRGQDSDLWEFVMGTLLLLDGREG